MGIQCMASLIEQFVAALQQAQRRVFHFTDARNIQSIREHGLLPTRTIIERGMDVITGGDEGSLLVDRQKGLDAFVSLSFCFSHPMAHVARQEGRIEAVRTLRICPSVLLRQGVLFSDQVATANAAKIASPNEMIPLMDFPAMYQRLDWRTPEGQQRRAAAEKWEALVPDPISPELIFNL
jgi:hypothetical protein